LHVTKPSLNAHLTFTWCTLLSEMRLWKQNHSTIYVAFWVEERLLPNSRMKKTRSWHCNCYICYGRYVSTQFQKALLLHRGNPLPTWLRPNQYDSYIRCAGESLCNSGRPSHCSTFATEGVPLPKLRLSQYNFPCWDPFVTNPWTVESLITNLCYRHFVLSVFLW
jgi:hypothetical protein